MGCSRGCSGVKQEHQPLGALMELPFFTAQVQSHFQSFGQRLVEGWGGRCVVSLPERSDPHGSGMPVEMGGFADGGFLQRLVEETVQGRAGESHAPSFGIWTSDGNRLRNFLTMRSRFETSVGSGLVMGFAPVPLRFLTLGV